MVFYLTALFLIPCLLVIYLVQDGSPWIFAGFFASVLLAWAWARAAISVRLRIERHSDRSNLDPARVLFVRSPFDEASGLISTGNFLAWATAGLSIFPLKFAGFLDKNFASCILRHPWLLWVPPVWILILAFIMFGGLFFIPAIVVSGIVGFVVVGPEMLLSPFLIEVSAEPCPEGEWVVAQLSTERDDGLRHSFSYSSPEALERIAAFIAPSFGPK